jgi:hypothetical protein
LLNLFLPGEHGAGLTNLQDAPVAEITGRSPELARAALNCSAPDTGNMEVLAYFGTPEQNKRWLQPLLNAEIRSAFAMTEPEVASSDATNIDSAGSFSGSPRVVFPLPGPSRPRHRADCARVLPAAQCRAVGGDHTAPDTVLADIPRPQRQFQALGAYKAGDADGNRRGRLVAGLACFRTGREPLVGIEAAVSAAGVPDDPGPQGLIRQRDRRRRIRRPASGPAQGVGGRPVIRRRGGA